MKLSDFAHEYVAYKRALGMRFDTEAEMLAAFCRRVGDAALVDVTADQVRSYLDGHLPLSSYWERKHTVLNGLFRFAMQCETTSRFRRFLAAIRNSRHL